MYIGPQHGRSSGGVNTWKARQRGEEAKPKAGPKLKVYIMPAGFYDAVVAVPSQAAALRAWGTTTDLFAAGRASVVEDETIRAEALAKPGEVLKRSRGDEAAMLGPKPKGGRNAKTVPPKPKAVPPPPLDRSKLDAAEQALSDAEREVADELSGIAAERAELDGREKKAKVAGDARLQRLRGSRADEEVAKARAAKR